jgi:hypothetical protein
MRRWTHILYPALLNLATCTVVLILCYGFGLGVFHLLKPTYGLSIDTVQTAVAWLALLYLMMIVGLSLWNLWHIARMEVRSSSDNKHADRSEQGRA